MTWVAISPSAPSGLSDIGSGIAQGLNALKTALTLVKTEAQAAALVVTSTESLAVQAANQAVNLLITTINNALNQLIDDAGLYVLAVPIPKRGLINLPARPDSQGEIGSNYIRFPINNVLAEASAELRAALQTNPIFQLITSPTTLLMGGNAYFVKTVAEALYDNGDINRPRLNASSFWAYAVLMAGSTDLTNILRMGAFFNRLTGGSSNVTHVGPDRGLTSLVPQNVRVAVSARGNVPVIQWDLVPAATTLTSFDNSTVVPIQYAIIRSKDFRTRTARRVSDLFSSNTLTEGMIGAYGATVVAVRDYDGIVTRYVDTSTLVVGETYYYQLAFSTRLNPPIFPNADLPTPTANVPQVAGFDLLSGCVTFQLPVHRSDYAGSAVSQAPDWVRTPSVISMIQPIEHFIGMIQEYLRTFQTTSNNVNALNNQYIAFLDREIAKYTAKIDLITQQITQISNIFSPPAPSSTTAGIYATLRTGSGNTSSLIGDLATAFNDQTDTNTPPFIDGTEFVTGVILLATGPDPNAIAAAFAMLAALFTPENSVDPAYTGIQSINTALATVEQGLLDQLGITAVVNPTVAFNNDLTPAAAGQGDANC